MKLVILAGGLRSTIHEDFEGIPKPMVEIGGRPLLWHIMKYYSRFGIKDFIICGGYKVNMLKDYFRDYYIYQSDITVDLESNTIEIHKKVTEDWKVTVVDTGLETTPGERIELVRHYIGDDDFIVTYGDCLSNLDIEEFTENHKRENKLATMMLARPTGRNAVVEEDDNAWANGCTFLYSNRIWEQMEKHMRTSRIYIPFGLEENELARYKHSGFWRPVETVRDRVELERMWDEGKAVWRIWE